LQNAGFDGTITLEVFTPDRRHLEYSREVLRRVWDEEEKTPTSNPDKQHRDLGGIQDPEELKTASSKPRATVVR